MSHLQYFSYKGFGEIAREASWTSQAVRVGDRIEISGQGGWDPATSQVPADLNDEVDQAFANVDMTLRDAGGKGWSQVYRINGYVVGMDEALFAAWLRNMKKWCPDHHPILTCVGVKELYMPNMRIELEVVAIDQEGAAKSST